MRKHLALLYMIDSVVQKKAAKDETTDQEWSFHWFVLPGGNDGFDSEGTVSVDLRIEA